MKNSALFHWYKREKRLLFGLSACIITVLLVFLSNSLDRAMAQAEEAMFRTVVAEINAMLVVKTAEKVAQNQKQEIKNFVNHNPMDWMDSTPVNYSGGVEGDYTEVAPGHWFFSLVENEIVYRVINKDMIEIPHMDEPEFVRFRVVLDYIDENNNQQFDEPAERLIGLKLESLQEYQWFAIKGR